MRNTSHWSLVIGVVLAETEAAQGQTEEVHAQTRKLTSVRGRARFGISIMGN